MKTDIYLDTSSEVKIQILMLNMKNINQIDLN